ncbi:sensor histidine kinase [Streptomyces millisiae]|uniref:histidine kinase n=1 Tax=Streptomyces millisiae TaxID=3075542 RepID=A0ABU2LWF2_9ACTN|nr:sensor histidine kinase [Streptomyces sp. DSM 44918]MDT0321925.1 sensor histidine kinase [Streptomyces sp. DSM 44918]
MPDSPSGTGRRRPRLVEAAVPVALLACSLPGSLLTLPGAERQTPWWPGVLLAGVSCAVLPWRRDRPRVTVALAAACATTTAALGYMLTVLLLLGPLMVALHSLAARADRRTANAFCAACVAALVAVALVAGPAEPLILKAVGPAGWLLLPTALGTAHRLRARQAERAQEERARFCVTEERLRIARELHDVVAHHLVLATIQAGTAARVLRDRPVEAERLVADLTGTTAAALRELRATVGLLRHANEAGPAPEPAPGVIGIAELAASFRGAGLSVTVATEGEPQPLTAGADLAAYRIAQEALTNVTKHGATRAAAVRLSYHHDRLRLTVTNADEGLRPAVGHAPGGGYGLLGMWERAVAAGGHLSAGPRAGGGFEVTAELPLDRGRP